MGKKKDQSLTERIGALISRVGEKPEPTFAYIKGELVDCRSLAQSLEESAAIRDAEAKAAVLEDENSNLRIELQALQNELEPVRAARKKQQEEEKWCKDIPEIQFEILRRLPSKHGGKGLTVLQLWREVGGRLDELDIHIEKLDKAKLITWRTDSSGDTFWLRSTAGNELVVAKRLAGEDEEQRPKRKHADRTPTEEEVLKILADCGDMTCEDVDPSANGDISADNAEVALFDLEKDGFVKIVEPAAAGKEAKYDLSIEGIRYLLERGYLH